MTSLSNNPVGRLYELLDAFQKSSHPGQTLDNVIRHVFQLNFDENNPAQRRAIYWEILNLIKASKMEINKFPSGSRELHLRAIRSVEEAFTNHGLHDPWEAFSRYLGAAIITGLQYTADMLSYQGECAVPRDMLENLKREVREAMRLVSRTAMDVRLRAFLLEHLEGIHQNVQYYGIRGAGGLTETLERMIGAAIIFTEEYRDVQTPEVVRSQVESTMQALVNVVGCANNLEALPHTNVTFLLNLPGGVTSP